MLINAFLQVLVNVLSTNFAFVLSFALAAKMVMSMGASRYTHVFFIMNFVKDLIFISPE